MSFYATDTSQQDWTAAGGHGDRRGKLTGYEPAPWSHEAAHTPPLHPLPATVTWRNPARSTGAGADGCYGQFVCMCMCVSVDIQRQRQVQSLREHRFESRLASSVLNVEVICVWCAVVGAKMSVQVSVLSANFIAASKASKLKVSRAGACHKQTKHLLRAPWTFGRPKEQLTSSFQLHILCNYKNFELLLLNIRLLKNKKKKADHYSKCIVYTSIGLFC